MLLEVWLDFSNVPITMLGIKDTAMNKADAISALTESDARGALENNKYDGCYDGNRHLTQSTMLVL